MKPGDLKPLVDKVEFRGELRTFDEIQRMTGIPARVMQARYSLGVPLDTVFIPRFRRAKTYMFRGQRHTVREIAEITGMNRWAVSSRARRGRPLEGLLKSGHKPAKLYEFRGRMATVKEIMVATGLADGSVRRRLDCNRYFEQYECTRPSKRYSYMGKVATLPQFAKMAGMTEATLRSRLRTGWTFQDALTKPVDKRRRVITIKGESGPIGYWAQKFKISKADIRKRLHILHWPVEAAIMQPVIERATRRQQLAPLLKLERYVNGTGPATIGPVPYDQ